MSENDTPPETADLLDASPAAWQAMPGGLKTSALRKIASALRRELPPLPTGSRAPATVVATVLPGVCRVTAQWVWITRGRTPGVFHVLYKAYTADDGRYLVHRVGAKQFASELSHKLRQRARATTVTPEPKTAQ